MVLTWPTYAHLLHLPSPQSTVDEAVAAHLCPPTATGWKTKVAHPSKSCRATSALTGHADTSAGQAASALHTMAVQVFQAKLLHFMDESGPDPTAFRAAPRNRPGPVRYKGKAISRSMASLVVLKCHLWLNLMEIKEADKTLYLDSPVCPLASLGLR